VLTENSKKPDGQKLSLLIFECFMAVLYLVCGVVFLFTPYFDAVFSNRIGLKPALGIVLGLYGIFRIYRAIKKLR
jgi:uncharacterized membrane protein HdeD (DUF308 family)